MAITSRKPGPSVAEDLYQNSYQYEFHQAIKILQILEPSLAKLGQGLVAHKEIARIKTNVTFSPPPSDIYSLVQASNQNASMSINFMGIAGHGGPLPDAYTEIIIDRNRSFDYAFGEFLDMFGHRIVSISHRIHVKYNFTLALEQPHQSQVARMLFSFGGIPEPTAVEGGVLPVRSYLKYIGHLWQQVHSVTSLKIILSDFFNLPIEIEEFIGEWLNLESSQTTTIGDQGTMNDLGNNACLGDRVWTNSEKIRIHIGSLTLKQYSEFFPGGDLNKKLSMMTRHYLGFRCQFDLSLQLSQRDIPFTKLDGTAHLGWTSWLKVPKEKPKAEWVLMRADDPLSVH